MADTPTERVTTVGRNVYLDGGHLAAAVSKEAAFVIAYCINTARSHEEMPSYPYASEDEKRVQEFLA